MTIVQVEDSRNQEWRSSNVGSKMLSKMGWTEGSGIGKRNVNTTALRAVKRQEGLGIGAKRQTEGGPSESTGTFAAVLANLKAHHGTTTSTSTTSKKKSSKKEAKAAKKAAKMAAKKKLSLPQNKVLAGHARKMREAKFGAKSAEDLACIFGNTEVVDTAMGGAFGSVPAITADTGTRNPKRQRASTAEESSSSSSVGENTPVEKKRKSKKETNDGEKKAKKEKKSKKEKKKSKKSKSE